MPIPQRKFTWVRDSHDHRDKLFQDHMGYKLSAIPKLIDLAPQMSPVQDQGQLGCCVGESSNGAVEFLERQYGIDSQFFGSVLYCYYNARTEKNEDSGAQIRDSVKAMSKLGVCKRDLFPFDPAKFRQPPSNAALVDGRKRVISDYLRAVSLSDIKQGLAAHHPVLCGFECYESLMSRETAKTGVVPMPGPREEFLGGHAILLVGYNDDKQLLKFKNSWGTGWGDHGYGYLPYEYITGGKLSSDYWIVRK